MKSKKVFCAQKQPMSRQALITNISTGIRVGIQVAESSIAACSAVWVEFKSTIRNVTEAEAIVLRNAQAAKRRIPTRALAYSEVFGVVYEPALSAAATHPMELGLALQADHFAMVATHVEVVASC